MATNNNLAKLGTALLATNDVYDKPATEFATTIYTFLRASLPSNGTKIEEAYDKLRQLLGHDISNMEALDIVGKIANQPADRTQYQNIVGIFLLAVAGITVCSRLGLGFFNRKRVSIREDATLWSSLVFIGAHVIAHSTSYISDVLTRHSWNVTILDLRHIVYMNFYANILYILALGLTKLALLSIYHNLIKIKFNNHLPRLLFWIVAIFVAGCTSATFFGSFGLCGKFHYWNYYPNLPAAKCTDWVKANIAAGVFDTLQIFFLLLLPATFLFSSSVKLILTARLISSSVLVASLGLVTLIASIMRTYALDQHYRSSDSTHSLIPSIYWAEVELCISLTAVTLFSIFFNISPPSNLSPTYHTSAIRSSSLRQYSARKQLSKLTTSITSSTRNLQDDSDFEEGINGDRSSTATVVVLRRLSDDQKPRIREICISPTSAFCPTNQKYSAFSLVDDRTSPRQPRPALLRNKSSLSDLRVFKTSRISVYEDDIEPDELYERKKKDSMEMVDVEAGFDGASYHQRSHSHGGFEPRGGDWQERQRMRLDLETGHNRTWKDLTGLKTSVTGGI